LWKGSEKGKGSVIEKKKDEGPLFERRVKKGVRLMSISVGKNATLQNPGGRRVKKKNN